ncbi:MAG: hypothetical protein AAF810_21310, partial [Cyanobacteria bacterium P01_D01_bin.36]
MTRRQVTDTLTTVSRFRVGSNAICFRAENSGNQPLTALKVKAYVNDEDVEGIIIIDTDAEWAAPASGSAIQHAEQRSSTGARETIAPTTLPAGSQIF